MRTHAGLMLVLVSALTACRPDTGATHPLDEPRTIIDNAESLPLWTFALPGEIAEVIKDLELTRATAATLEAHIQTLLNDYDIRDRATLAAFHDLLGAVALLRGNGPAYLQALELKKGYLDKEAEILTTGLLESVIARHPAGTDAELQAALRAELEALPYEKAGIAIRELKGQLESMSPGMALGMVNMVFERLTGNAAPELTRDELTAFVQLAKLYHVMLPRNAAFLPVLKEYLRAHHVVKPDIWRARDVSLSPDLALEPVVIAAWDSGTDVPVLGGNGWRNLNEIPGNGVDDDANGFVDDVFGIGWTTDGSYLPTGETLRPMSEQDRLRLEPSMAAYSDLAEGIESEGAEQLQQKIATLQPDEVKEFFEDLGDYAYYAHGTHVAGLMVQGNPFARAMAAKLGFPDDPKIPLVADEQSAHALARSFEDAIKYFKTAKVRVVNMSWGIGLASIEADLARKGVGANAEERAEKAKALYEICESAFLRALADAPGILFINSAGNSNHSNEFNREFPSSHHLGNMLTVGAVDQAGDETSFTSLGNVDVYANGYQVESFVPGGGRQKMSGTSMSSPLVANLAAKLMVVRPELNVAQIRSLILETATHKELANGRIIRLIHPAAALELAKTSR